MSETFTSLKRQDELMRENERLRAERDTIALACDEAECRCKELLEENADLQDERDRLREAIRQHVKKLDGAGFQDWVSPEIRAATKEKVE